MVRGKRKKKLRPEALGAALDNLSDNLGFSRYAWTSRIDAPHDAKWNSSEQVWQESDAAFRRRVLAESLPDHRGSISSIAAAFAMFKREHFPIATDGRLIVFGHLSPWRWALMRGCLWVLKRICRAELV